MTGRKPTDSPRGLPGLHCRRRLYGTLGGRLQEPGRAPVGPNCTMNTYWLVPEDRPALHTKHVRWLWGPLSRRAWSGDPGAAAGVQSEALNAEREGGIPTDRRTGARHTQPPGGAGVRTRVCSVWSCAPRQGGRGRVCARVCTRLCVHALCPQSCTCPCTRVSPKLPAETNGRCSVLREP